jgi:hypothetical protein
MTRQLAEQFVATYHGDELPYLGFIWDEFLARWGAGFPAQTTKAGRESVRKLGLGLEGDDAIPLAAPYVVATVAAVFAELRSRGSIPGLEQVKSAVRSSAMHFGAWKKLSDQLAETVGPKLWRAFSEGKASGTAEGPSAKQGRSTEKKVYLVSLLGGELSNPKEYQPRESVALLKNNSFEIVLNELELTLTVRARNCVAAPRRIFQLPGMQRGMLWLVLTHVGNYIHHDSIGKLFRFTVSDDRRRLYQYRTALGKLVGPHLRERMVRESTHYAYEVPTRGWSFCWIRQEEDPQLSALVTDLGSRRTASMGGGPVR